MKYIIILGILGYLIYKVGAFFYKVRKHTREIMAQMQGNSKSNNEVLFEKDGMKVYKSPEERSSGDFVSYEEIRE